MSLYFSSVIVNSIFVFLAITAARLGENGSATSKKILRTIKNEKIIVTTQQ